MATFVITGSTKGIGFALAKCAVELGHNAVLSGRAPADVQAAVAKCAGGRGQAFGVATDVTDPSQVQALWDAAVQRFGRVDIWVNNAGVANTTKSIVDASDADIRNMVTTNMFGGINGSRVAARGMVKQGGGKIFNVLGGGSDGEYFPGMGIYGATKRGLDYMTLALQKELAGTPVLVGRVRPGVLLTEGMIREVKADPAGFAKARKMLNILGDLPQTVAPYLVGEMLATTKTGTKIKWLTGGKIAGRFMTASFKPRPDLFQTAGL